MANQSVLELAVNTGKWDAGLSKARKALDNFTQSSGGLQQALDKDSAKMGKFVQIMGKTESTAKTARGQMNDYKNTIEQLTLQYNRMTDAQKKSIGQDYLQAIDQLKQRFNDSKRQLEEVSRSLEQTSNEGQKTGGVMKQLADRFTINIDAMKLFDIGLKAINGAMSVVKDAFGASEANVDEWGRIVQSAHSVYDGFLNALNTGDISGFLGRIDEIIIAARNAYDELDRLGTLQTIQKTSKSSQQTENDRLRMMIMTRRYIPKAEGLDLLGFGMKSGQLLTDGQVRLFEQRLQSGMNKVVDMTSAEVKQSRRAIDAFYESFAKDIGMTVDEFRRGTSSMEEFDKRVKGAQAYNEWQYQNSFIDQQTGRMVAPRGGNPYAQYKGWDVFRVDGERYNNLVELILQHNQGVNQLYAMQGQAYRTINRAEGITSRIGGGGGGGGRTGSTPAVKEVREMTGLIELQQQKVKDLQTQIAQAPTETMITYLQGDLKVAQDELDRLQGKVKEVNGEGLQLVTTETLGPLEILEDQLKTIQESMKAAITPEDYAEMLAAAADVQEQINAFKGENKKETKTVNLSQEIGNIVSGISGMTSSIEQLGIELPEGMKDVLGGIQSMVSILTSIGTIVSAIEAISAADIITPFARGGVVHAAGGYKVPGNHYSGDNIPALLDAGEVVLNRAQAASLASDLQSGVGAGGYRPSYISGEQIFLALNRYTKRTGKGELVTWRD